MIEVREVIRRWKAEQGLRQIARETGLDRKTVRRYIDALDAHGASRDDELDDELVGMVARTVQTRPVPEPSASRQVLMEHRERLEKWLCGPKALRLTKVHRLLTDDHRVIVTYAALRRFAMDELGWSKRKPTVLIADAPAGQEAQVDFGLMGLMFDPETKRERKLYVLVVTLCFSRYQFVWPTWDQTTATVCEGLDAAWKFFGGVVRHIIPDNASSMVSRADALEPKIVDAFAEYAQMRNLFIDAARVRSPRDKGRVENQMAYVRESWFAGERFEDLRAARDGARHWCSDIAGRRIHGTTRAVPREVFEAEERPVLRAAPTEPFDVPYWGEAKVHPDHHVQVLKSLYSVPTRFIGKTVRVRADRRTVRVYVRNELIKTHPRVAVGKKSTDSNDYPVGKAEYAMRSVDALLSRLGERGPHVGAFARTLLGGALPWTTMRRGYELLRLCDRHGDARVDALCKQSIDFEIYDVPRIGRMIRQAIAGEERAAQEGKLTLLNDKPLRFARDAAGFSTKKDGPNGGAR